MEISIDLNMLNQIVYHDPQLVKQMLEEWKSDLTLREQAIEQAIRAHNDPHIFKGLHELKSSYQMIGCKTGLRYLESMIQKLNNKEQLVSSIETLRNIGFETVQEIDRYIITHS